MKKLVISLFLMVFAGIIEAQTIHWLTFIDTKDERVGKIDVLGRQVLYSHFINEVNAALSEEGYDADVQDFYDYKMTPENCKAAVELLRVDPKDIIVFYYIGHGGRPTTDTGYMKEHPYPQMCLGQWNQNKYIPLEWVNKMLSSKGARLSVTIGMCCNSLSNITIKDGPTFTPNYGAADMSSNKIKRIQELFLNYKGSVLATSASPTQTSGCFPTPLGVIDRYTTVLCNIFDNSLDNLDVELNWDLLLGSIGRIINEKTDGDQTPIFETHLQKVSGQKTAPKRQAPTQQQVQQTKQQQTPSSTKQKGNGDDWINSINSKLRSLINVEIGENNRQKLEAQLNDLLAPNAVVRILGQDSETVIDKEEASDFLGRLATSRLLLYVSVEEGTFDSNHRIKTLKVREYYKKK